jgi:cytidyltransferase-like protein
MIISSKNKFKIKKINRPFVFVPMSADIIHYGHTRLLNKASKYGNIIVGLMTDKGISSYKSKPFFSFRQRHEVLKSFKNISIIIPLEGLIYDKICNVIKPDFFIHGSDWNKGPQMKQKIILENVMKQWSGELITIKYTDGISSTKIKKKLSKEN